MRVKVQYADGKCDEVDVVELTRKLTTVRPPVEGLRGARTARCFIATQSRWNLVRRFRDFARKDGGIFDGKGCALCKKGQNRMGSITEERHVMGSP